MLSTNDGGLRRKRHIYCSVLEKSIVSYGVEEFLRRQGIETEQLGLYREKIKGI